MEAYDILPPILPEFETSTPAPDAVPTPAPATLVAAPPAMPPTLPPPEATQDTDDPSFNHRRTGFVARLPKDAREKVNRLIDDGVPYAKIIEELGDLGKALNENHLTSWRKGGYLDWVDHQARLAALGATRDAALALVETKSGATVQDAGRSIASAQLYELLLSFNGERLVKMFEQKPELYFRVLTALARLSESEVACSRRRSVTPNGIFGSKAADGTESAENKPPVISGERLQELIRLIKLI
jgi:hypothetical protein